MLKAASHAEFPQYQWTPHAPPTVAVTQLASTPQNPDGTKTWPPTNGYGQTGYNPTKLMVQPT